MKAEEHERGMHLLETLYELASADLPASPSNLAESLGIASSELTPLLRRLDAEGLVDAKRCRLTMSGLVLAVSRAGSSKVSRRAA